MSFSDKVKTYRIDLDREEAERWREVIRGEKRVAKDLVETALEDFRYHDTWVGGWIKKLLRSMYKASGGRYVEEMEAWAASLEIKPEDLLLLQCSYELAHFGKRLRSSLPRIPWRKVFGCTAGVRAITGDRMVHLRNMDWPVEGLGAATRIFRFVRGSREFVTVGVPGLIGVLSGMVPGGYSATINDAPPVDQPGFDFGPLFLLREVLETCDTFEEAVDALKNTPLSSSVFFMVCGAEKDQACVVERTRDEASVRSFRGAPLVQANHFNSSRFREHNGILRVEEDEDSLAAWYDSKDRQETLTTELEKCGARATLDRVADTLETEPVLNDQTQHRMVFCPHSGEYRVWRRIG